MEDHAAHITMGALYDRAWACETLEELQGVLNSAKMAQIKALPADTNPGVLRHRKNLGAALRVKRSRLERQEAARKERAQRERK